MIINSVNGVNIVDLDSYNAAISIIKNEDVVKLGTNQGEISLIAGQKENEIDLGMSVNKIAPHNLRKGLDLAGGVRVLLQPETGTNSQTMQDIITITQKRLNAFGIADIIVRKSSDFEGNDYILVEIPGANKETIANLISRQGKFEAKIGNESIFRGGSDIKQVCRSPECSGIDPQSGCGQSSDGWACQFQFRVDISTEAAQRHAAVTRDLDIITEGTHKYLSKKLDLYLDDSLVDSLFISSDLKGSDTTTFVIQGPGAGKTKEEAVINSLNNMKEMQTILITGSLPVKLNVVKIDVVSPTLGDDFLKVAIMALLTAVIFVFIVLLIRYRNIKISSLILITSLSEVMLIFGAAAAINWRLDLASLAGIIAAVGTGVDSQIVLTDEFLSGEKNQVSQKLRFKTAFFIIFGSYATLIVAMIPLGWMGAGMVRGFALTTIIGVTMGVFITRPAYAKIIEVLLRKKN